MHVTIIKATNVSHTYISNRDDESTMIKIALLEGDLKLR